VRNSFNSVPGTHLGLDARSGAHF